MPESCKVTLKARLASEVAHMRQLRSGVRIVAIADAAADNWTFLKTLSPETESHRLHVTYCEHLRTASDHAVVDQLEKREKPRRFSGKTADGVDKVDLSD